MTITIAAPELEVSLTKAAAASNTTVDEYVSQILQRAIASEQPPATDQPLQGSVLYYHDPFEPVALDDWEVLREEPPAQPPARTLTGYGKFAHIPTSSDEFAARKDEEKARENRRNWTVS